MGIARKLGGDRSIAFRRSTLADTYYCMEQYERSQQEVNLGRPLAESANDLQLRAYFLTREGVLALQRSRPNEAIGFLAEGRGLGYRRSNPEILALYAIALARTKDFSEANNAAILGVNACDDLIREVPKHYEMYYFRGLAQAVLAVVDKKQREEYLAQMLDSYQRAFDICHERGEIQYHRLLLNELKPLDRDDLLGPVYKLLATAEHAAV